MANKPKIRFKGFDDAWEQRKVSELCSIATGKSNTQDKVEDGEYPFYVRSPVIERSNKYLYDEEAVLTVGDGVGTGKVFHYVNGKYDLHQRCYRIFDFSNKLDAKYFYQVFSKLFYRRVMTMTAKTSVDSVRMEMIADMKIPVSSFKEQLKIGRYFETIDNLITLHQRKCDQMKELKKYMLTKMFPQNGAKVPEIRFDGFIDDWEQRKLGDVCSRVQGNDGRMELPTLTISASNGWMKQEDRFSGNIAGKEQKNYTLLHKGELSYNHGNSKLAKYGTVFSLQSYEEALVPRVYHSFKVEEGNTDFIEYYFATKLPDRELGKLISSGARMDGLLNIGYKEFMGIQLLFPKTKEQECIANYFRNLDHLITLHQHKCNELREIKKYMLKNMFI